MADTTQRMNQWKAVWNNVNRYTATLINERLRNKLFQGDVSDPVFRAWYSKLSNQVRGELSVFWEPVRPVSAFFRRNSPILLEIHPQDIGHIDPSEHRQEIYDATTEALIDTAPDWLPAVLEDFLRSESPQGVYK